MRRKLLIRNPKY